MDAGLAQALEGLRDIHLPPPVAAWPPAPGWWALMGVVVLTAAGVTWLVRRRRRSVRRLALRELGALEARLGAGADPVELAIALTALLRRVALAGQTSAQVASLHGERWVALLAGAGEPTGRSPQVARELIETAYRGPHAAAGDPRAWLALAGSWIREVA